jgi:hypothetical protein
VTFGVESRGVSGPKAAMELGMNTFRPYFLATSKIFLLFRQHTQTHHTLASHHITSEQLNIRSRNAGSLPLYSPSPSPSLSLLSLSRSLSFSPSPSPSLSLCVLFSSPGSIHIDTQTQIGISLAHGRQDAREMDDSRHVVVDHKLLDATRLEDVQELERAWVK